MAGHRTDTVYTEIADRLAYQTEEQVIRLGRRSGQWTEEQVDWVLAGNQGPMPSTTTSTPNADRAKPIPPSTDDDQVDQPTNDDQVDQPTDDDLLARGLAHPDPKVRAIATRAAAAVDQLVTALARRAS